MVVYVLYHSYMVKDLPETEILGVYSSEEACQSAQHVFIEDNKDYIRNELDVCYHECIMDM